MMYMVVETQSDIDYLLPSPKLVDVIHTEAIEETLSLHFCFVARLAPSFIWF